MILKKDDVKIIKMMARTIDNRFVQKREARLKKIKQLENEIEQINKDISLWEMGVKSMTGYGIEELTRKVVENGMTKFVINDNLPGISSVADVEDDANENFVKDIEEADEEEFINDDNNDNYEIEDNTKELTENIF